MKGLDGGWSSKAREFWSAGESIRSPFSPVGADRSFRAGTDPLDPLRRQLPSRGAEPDELDAARAGLGRLPGS